MGRHKRKSPKHFLCTVCAGSNLFSTSRIPPCCSCFSLHRTSICDQCLHKYILHSITESITNPVICPAYDCHTILSELTIQTALTEFGYRSLWEDYKLKSNWLGTNEEWIQTFAVKCPTCGVPIEKNGGCDHMLCIRCRYPFSWIKAKNQENPYGGGNLFAGGSPFQYPGSFPQQGFGQVVGNGGYFNGFSQYPAGNVYPSGALLPPNASIPGGFSSPVMNGQYGSNFNFPPMSGGYGYQQPPYMPPYPAAAQPPFPSTPQPPYVTQFPPAQPQYPSTPQRPYVSPFPPAQAQPGGHNYFGSGSYPRNRSRHSSRRRSKSRHRNASSSSSSSASNADNAHRRRGSPFAGANNPVGHASPYQNTQPRASSPFMPPRPPAW